MGTTLVMAWLMDRKAYICWCGDSRCYVFNPAVGLTRLTKDHSLVQQLVDKGELAPEEAHKHPMSNIITQCLGNTATRISPDTRVYQMAHNDVLLLCTDGLCGLCTDDEIMQVMAANDDIVAMKSQLIEQALKAGGYDNVTVAICHIDATALKEGGIKSVHLNATLRTQPEKEENDEDTTQQENSNKNLNDVTDGLPEAEATGTVHRDDCEADTDALIESKNRENALPSEKSKHKHKRWLWVVLVSLIIIFAALLAFFCLPEQYVNMIRSFVFSNLLP